MEKSNGDKSMGQTSQSNPEQLSIVEAQIRECFGRIVWTHKTQEKCADILQKRLSRIKVSQIVLSALTTTSLLTALFGNSEWGVILGALFSTALLALNSYVKDYDLGEIAQKHSSAANELWSIRESYLSLLTDIRVNSLSVEQIRARRDDLQESLSNIYKGAPRTISKAYVEASKALKVNEELTFSDEEIDMFLPRELRKT